MSEANARMEHLGINKHITVNETIMKSLNQYIKEKLIINKDYREAKVAVPKTFDELRKIIEDRYYKLGPGTEQDPIDFNDIDVSNLDSFCNKYNTGIFEGTKFNYIDISYWDVSNVKEMRNMFYLSEKLKSVGDLSGWDVSKVTNMSNMFYECKELEYVGDLSDWNVSKVTGMLHMFYYCRELKSVGDISDWNVSNVKNHVEMFDFCPINDEYKPKFK